MGTQPRTAGMLATLAGTDRGQILTTGARSPRRDATSAQALGAWKGVHKKQHGCSEQSGCDRNDQTSNPCADVRAVFLASDEHFDHEFRLESFPWCALNSLARLLPFRAGR